MVKSGAKKSTGGKAVKPSVILYVKELRQLKPVNSINACLLMQQLEYWFERHPHSFFKFLEPCEAIGYRKGDSWCEEMGFSADEFRTAFDQIGVRYKSKKEFDEAANKFQVRDNAGEWQEKYYCSYFDKIRRQTFYFRNHVVVDAALATLQSAELGEAKTYSSEEASSRDRQGQATEDGKGKPEYTETTTQTTTQITQEREEGSHSGYIHEEVGYSSSSLESSSTEDTELFRAEEIIDAEPVFDDEPRAAAGVGAETVLPADFRLTEEMRAWAKEHNPNVDVDGATTKFIVYHNGKSRRDWPQAWQMWILRERPNVSSARSLTPSEIRTAEINRKLATLPQRIADSVEDESMYAAMARLRSSPKYANPKTASERRTNELIDRESVDIFADVTD